MNRMISRFQHQGLLAFQYYKIKDIGDMIVLIFFVFDSFTMLYINNSSCYPLNATTLITTLEHYSILAGLYKQEETNTNHHCKRM